MIYTVTLNPALDKTAEIDHFAVDTVNRIRTLRTDAGGKGINVSKVLAKLGGRSTALGLLAGQCGRGIVQALTAAGIGCDFLYVEGETRTNLKIIDPAAHTNTDINEPGPAVRPQALDTLLRHLLGRLAAGDIVVLAGSLPGGAPCDTYGVWTKACRAAGAKVFLDADGELLARGLEGVPYLVKPNRDELCRLTGQTLETPAQLAAAGGGLLRRGMEKVVISLGGEGALFLTAAGAWRAEGLRVPVGSTVGAGDAMVAALARSEELGLPMPETIRLAMAASAANVMCSGTQAAEYAAIAPLLEKVRFEAMEL